MYQATTPTYTINCGSTSPDLRTLGTCIVSIRQGSLALDITPTVNEHTVVFCLTQAQTVKFKPCGATAQANFIGQDGSRVCTNILTINVFENLKNEVL